MIRPARPGDFERCRAIEVAAGERFREVGMGWIADHPPPSDERLRSYAGRSWVVEADGSVAGYVLVDVVDGCAHVEQVSVDPSHQGRGFGRALLDEVSRWAADRGMPAVTLTTFTDVPWNGPLYAHLGFRALAEPEVTPGLRAVRDHEAEMGLDPALRSVMGRDVPLAPSGHPA